MSWQAILCVSALAFAVLPAMLLCKVKGKRHRRKGKHHSRGKTNGR
jgi:hypothetical protein